MFGIKIKVLKSFSLKFYVQIMTRYLEYIKNITKTTEKIVPLILLFIWKYGIQFLIEHLYIHSLHKLLATFHYFKTKNNFLWQL